jgi:predicted nucleotidyltransferase
MPTVVECKRESAEWSVKALVDQIRSIEAVLLFGSVARGDATADSDVDLIIVASDPLRSVQVREALGEEHWPTSITCHTWDSLAAAREEEWSFFVHLREEGEVLYGGPELKRSIDRTHSPDFTVWKARLGEELERLDRFDDLDRYSAGYNLPLARIFRTARYSCMLENTAAGESAFSRNACFDVFARRHPEVSAETDLVQRLWPFHARAQGRRGQTLPFEPEVETDVVEAREAARAVVGAALHG